MQVPSPPPSNLNLPTVTSALDANGRAYVYICPEGTQSAEKLGDTSIAASDALYIQTACTQRADLLSKHEDQRRRLELISKADWGEVRETEPGSIYGRIRTIASLASKLPGSFPSRYPYASLDSDSPPSVLPPKVTLEDEPPIGLRLAVEGADTTISYLSCRLDQRADVAAIAGACAEHELLKERNSVMATSLEQIATMDRYAPEKYIDSAKCFADAALAELDLEEMVAQLMQERHRSVMEPNTPNHQLSL